MSKQSGFVRIPKERVGVLIGPEGKVKEHIEERLKVKLEISGEQGGPRPLKRWVRTFIKIDDQGLSSLSFKRTMEQNTPATHSKQKITKQ